MAINLIKENYLFVVEGISEEFEVIKIIFNTLKSKAPITREQYFEFDKTYKLESLVYENELVIDIYYTLVLIQLVQFIMNYLQELTIRILEKLLIID